MLIHARRSLDLSPDQFWDLTLREYSRECAAAAGRLRDAYNARLMQAWKTISFLSQAMSPRGLPDFARQMLREPGELGDLDRPPSLSFAEVENFAASHGLKRRPLSLAGKEAIRKMRADAQRNKAMSEEAIAEARKRLAWMSRN